MRRPLVTLIAGAMFAAAPALAQTNGAQTKLEVSHFPGANWVLLIGQNEGFFAREKLDVHLDPVRGSVEQINGTMAGKYDLGLTALDNVIAYDAGQGAAEVQQPTDLFAFMGGEQLALKFIASPDIKQLEDLKGKTLAVDAKNTGFAFVLYSALAKHKLAAGDYNVLAVGSSQARLDAITSGKAQAAGLNRPFDAIALTKGAVNLGDMRKLYPHYQASAGFARRAWAAQHRDVLLAFIRAYVKSSLWLFDASHKAAAVDLLMKNTDGLSAQQAADIYRDTAGKGGIGSPTAKLDPAGVDTVVKLRNEYGEPKKKLNPRDFYDLSYYKAATK
ncbi:MAG TPA: ABC transporter substrate-binding protein [Stellaceae bacterium]|jgi:ABC-type nitrate/sulfonate/bicarbonate transport system substrate-binding protein